MGGFGFDWFVLAGAGFYVGWTFAAAVRGALSSFWQAFKEGFARGRARNDSDQQ